MKKPNFTQVPNEFIDSYMSQVSGAASKVFNAICRKTIGYHKDCEAISQGELMELTGLSLNSVKSAVRELEESGNELVRTWKKGRGRNTQTYYELYFSDSMSKIDIEGNSNGSKIDTLNGFNGSKIDTLNGFNGSKIDTIINKRNLKEKEEKESSTHPSKSENDIDVLKTIKWLIDFWNERARSTKLIPDYRYTAANLPCIGDIEKSVQQFTETEFEDALKNYLTILSDLSKYKPFPIYTGFEGFIKGGISAYRSEARPFMRCSRSGKEELPGIKETTEERLKRLELKEEEAV